MIFCIPCHNLHYPTYLSTHKCTSRPGGSQNFKRCIMVANTIRRLNYLGLIFFLINRQPPVNRFTREGSYIEGPRTTDPIPVSIHLGRGRHRNTILVLRRKRRQSGGNRLRSDTETEKEEVLRWYIFLSMYKPRITIRKDKTL